MDHGEQLQHQWKPFPYKVANQHLYLDVKNSLCVNWNLIAQVNVACQFEESYHFPSRCVHINGPEESMMCAK